MIFKDTCAFLQRLNGDSFDAEMLDRTLERSEALHTLKRQHPRILIYGPNSRQWKEDYRDYLAELGLTNKKQQDLVISRMESDEPYTDAEILAIVKASSAAQEEPIRV